MADFRRSMQIALSSGLWTFSLATDQGGAGVAAAEHWARTTSELFANAPYHEPADPLARVLAYIDFRRALIDGDPAEFTCLASSSMRQRSSRHRGSDEGAPDEARLGRGELGRPYASGPAGCIHPRQGYRQSHGRDRHHRSPGAVREAALFRSSLGHTKETPMTQDAPVNPAAGGTGPTHELVLDRVLDAPRAALWRCWTEPELLKQWFCPKPWFVSDVRMDLRPGGEFFALMSGPLERRGQEGARGNGLPRGLEQGRRPARRTGPLALTCWLRPASRQRHSERRIESGPTRPPATRPARRCRR